MLPPPSTDLELGVDAAGAAPAPAASPSTPLPDPLSGPGVADVPTAEVAQRLISSIDAVIAGQHDIAELAVTTLFAGGHLLIEDIPGVGKTLLAQTLARTVGGSFSRIQGTPDLLPGDILGAMAPVSGGDGHRLAFRPGPIFANVVVLDELNRATPRTQSALLESAEEATVSVDGHVHTLPDPFLLVATQNPIEIAGTYGLGEGSLDRFATVVTPGRPAPDAEVEVLTGRRGRSVLDGVRAETDTTTLRAIRARVVQVHVADPIGWYVHEILDATRRHPAVRLGASTRAGVSLLALARSRAAMAGRDHVVADDVAHLAVEALAHRVLTLDTDGTTTAGRGLVAECVASVAPPTA
ncbi:MAG: MoxR family ATPase [Actinomycetota bacterium]